VPYDVFRMDELEFGPPSAGDQRRGIVRLSDVMRNMRANLWRLPPGVRGRRHAEQVQEEVFVAVDGTTTLLLGDPGEPVELPRGSVAVVQPGTPLQVRNDGDVDAVVLIVGAPPETGQVDYLPDVD
jgi:mannose-6-phosphate isomerase-like protein (cupin superfamily)